jgi:hypothetical protein
MITYVDIFALLEESKLTCEGDLSDNVKSVVMKPLPHIYRVSFRRELA